MSGRADRGPRRLLTVAAVGIMVGLPAAAFLVAPPVGAEVPAADPGGTPASNLAGINTSATGSAVLIEPLTPGVVGAGDVAKGDLIQASVPYAAADASTGPATDAIGAPAYPGPTAADIGGAFETLSPSFPATLANLLNDHVLASAAYPAQVQTGSSSSYQLPTPSPLGAGTAHATAAQGGSSATATVTDTVVPGLLEVDSSSVAASDTILAGSVSTRAETAIGRVKLLAGAIQIAGITSSATASSDGTNGQQSSELHVGAVTVAGLSASIGPDGIHVNKTGLLSPLVPLANQVLVALQQAGISVTTLAPTSQQEQNTASVTSGAVQISFVDQNIPNPQGRLPVGGSIGLQFDLGLSQASANVTGLPPFPPIPGVNTPLPPVAAPAGGAAGLGVPSGGGAVPAAAPTGPSLSPTPAPAGASNGGSAPAGTSPAPMSAAPIGFLGLPVRVAWIVAAFLLSLVAAGPLLAYANWQLLRGRTS